MAGSTEATQAAPEAPARGSLAGRLCAINAATAGQDPIGSGGTLACLLAIETPTPWGESLYRADPAGTVRQHIRAVQLAHLERLRADLLPTPTGGGAR